MQVGGLGTEGPGRPKSVPGEHGERSFPEELMRLAVAKMQGGTNNPYCWNGEARSEVTRRTQGRIGYSRLSSAERYEQGCGGWEAQADVASASPRRCAFTQNCRDEDS
jgi:hypothetical protein